MGSQSTQSTQLPSTLLQRNDTVQLRWRQYGSNFPTGRTKSTSGAQFAALSLVKPVVDLRARAKSAKSTTYIHDLSIWP